MTRLNYNKINNKNRKRRSFPRANPWSSAEIRFLLDNYIDKGPRKVAESLGRTYSAVTHQAIRLNIRRTFRWSKNEVEYLRRNAAKKSSRELAAILGRQPNAIREAARSRGLHVNTENWRIWTKKEINHIINNYGNMSFDELA